MNRDKIMDNPTGQPITEIRIIRSLKRKKTVSARLNNGVLAIYAPSGIPDKELQPIIARFKERILRKKFKKELDRKQDLK